MAVSYKKLWKLLIDRKMLKKDLKDSAGLSPYIMAQLGHDRNTSTQILSDICEALDCSIEDVVEIVPDENRKQKSLI